MTHELNKAFQYDNKFWVIEYINSNQNDNSET